MADCRKNFPLGIQKKGVFILHHLKVEVLIYLRPGVSVFLKFPRTGQTRRNPAEPFRPGLTQGGFLYLFVGNREKATGDNYQP